MSSDGSQQIDWAGQAFSFLPKWHQAAPHGEQRRCRDARHPARWPSDAA